MATAPSTTAVAIFAHNEERRIGACLASLPLDRDDIAFHLLINGSTDRTAEIARAETERHGNLTIHELTLGGKARTWNRFVYDILPEAIPDTVVFMDGDAQIAAGSLDALVQALADHPRALAVAGLPFNGRSHAAYQAMIRREGGLFGDLYALRGSFLQLIRDAGYRLPLDLIGDDGLVAAWAATDLGKDENWDRVRLGHADGAGFYCEPVSLMEPRSWQLQYKRMIAYSIRYFQGQIISHIMSESGPAGLPERLSSFYADWLPRFTPRAGPVNALFDRLALRRMRRAMENDQSA